MTKNILKTALYILFLILIAIVTIELMAVKIVPGLATWHDFMADTDHRMEPYEKKDINADGIRSYRASDDFHEDDFNVIFLGDSFTYAMWLSSEESIPHQFEQLSRKYFPDHNVKAANFGWISSSPLLSERLLKDIGHKYKPDLVILILDMSDFYDDILYKNIMDKKYIFKWAKYLPSTTALIHSVVRYQIRDDGLSRKLSGLPMQRYFVTEYPPEETRYALENTTRILESINDYTVTELDSTFVTVVLPRYYQYNINESPNDWSYRSYRQPAKIPTDYPEVPFDYYTEQQHILDFEVISLLDDFKNTDIFPTTLDGDPHLNSEGCRFAAEAIFQHCLERGCFPDNFQ